MRKECDPCIYTFWTFSCVRRDVQRQCVDVVSSRDDELIQSSRPDSSERPRLSSPFVHDNTFTAAALAPSSPRRRETLALSLGGPLSFFCTRPWSGSAELGESLESPIGRRATEQRRRSHGGRSADRVRCHRRRDRYTEPPRIDFRGPPLSAAINASAPRSLQTFKNVASAPLAGPLSPRRRRDVSRAGMPPRCTSARKDLRSDPNAFWTSQLTFHTAAGFQGPPRGDFVGNGVDSAFLLRLSIFLIAARPVASVVAGQLLPPFSVRLRSS